MKYVEFLKGERRVSRLCLGTVNFGTSVKEGLAFDLLDRFIDAGGNFLDTANVYGRWEPAWTNASEQVIGRYLKSRGGRDRLVISTKGAHPPIENMSQSRVSDKEIRNDLEESLRALGTDYIDCYFLHRDDTSIPVSDILGIMEKLKEEGKVLHYGCSNWTLRRVMDADADAMWSHREGFACNQILLSLADTNSSGITDKTMVAMDRKFFDYHSTTGKPVMAYMALAKGYFSKVLHGTPVSDSLKAMYDNRFNRYVLEHFPSYKKQFGTASTPIILSYLSSQTFPVVPIASFSSIDQLNEGLASCDIDFPTDLRDSLNSMRRFEC